MKKNILKSTLALALVATIIVGCTTTKVTETPPGSGVYSTNVVVDPKLESALTTAGVINAATAPVNPFSPLVEIGLGAIAAFATFFAKRKNDALNSTAGQLKATIQGIEMTPDSGAVKASIQAHATRLGIEGELSKTVLAVTGS